MGLQDRDYYWEKRDDLEGRRRRHESERTEAASADSQSSPFISAETFARVAREQARNRAGGWKRQGAPNWLAIAGLLFIVVCAVVGFVQVLGWIRPWH